MAREQGLRRGGPEVNVPARIAQAASSRWRLMFKPAELSKLLAAMKSLEWRPS